MPLLPLSRIGAATVGTSFTMFQPSVSAMLVTYKTHFAPAVIVLIAILSLFCIGQLTNAVRSSNEINAFRMRRHEIMALLTCLFLPAVVLLIAMAVKSPYFDRYSLFTVAGLAGLLGIAAARKPLIGIALLAL